MVASSLYYRNQKRRGQMMALDLCRRGRERSGELLRVFVGNIVAVEVLVVASDAVVVLDLRLVVGVRILEILGPVSESGVESLGLHSHLVVDR